MPQMVCLTCPFQDKEEEGGEEEEDDEVGIPMRMLCLLYAVG